MTRDGRRLGPERHQPRLGDVASRRCAGATSGCCSRCRARASATPPSRRSADDEQLERFDGVWAGDGDHRAGHRLGLRQHHARPRSWTATSTSSTARRSSSPPASAPTPSWSGRRSTRSSGRAAIKSFVVPKGTPGMRVERLEHKLGIRASDTATIIFEDCRVPAENLLGSPEVDTKAGLRRRDGDLRQHPAAGRRDGGRLRPGVARPDPRAARARPASRSTTTGRRTRSRRPPRSSSRWRPTGRAPGC